MKTGIALSVTSWTILCVPSMASANMGLPMIVITLPGMVAALIPIIVLEMFIIKAMLASRWREAAVASTVANVTSTLIGVPLAWIASFILGTMVAIPSGYLHMNLGPILGSILLSAWLVPDEGNARWKIPLAAMVLLVWFFYASFWIERNVGRRFLKNYTIDQIDKVFWRGNIASYALLELVAAGFLVYALATKHM